MSSRGGSRGGGRPQIDFNQYKDVLYNLYITDGQSLDNVRRYMQSRHSFNPRHVLLLGYLCFIYLYRVVNVRTNANLRNGNLIQSGILLLITELLFKKLNVCGI
jgi:hypothetical protein